MKWTSDRLFDLAETMLRVPVMAYDSSSDTRVETNEEQTELDDGRLKTARRIFELALNYRKLELEQQHEDRQHQLTKEAQAEDLKRYRATMREEKRRFNVTNPDRSSDRPPGSEYV